MSNKEEKPASSPEKPESLEEKFEHLRGEGKKDDEIIREIFTEDLNADVGEICAITGLDSLTVGRIKGQVARWAKKPSEPEVTEPETKEEAVEAEARGVPPEDISRLSPREIVLFYQEEGLEYLKKERLLKLLSSAPGVGKRSTLWVLEQWKYDENIRRDPNALFATLESAGVKPPIAHRITSAVSSLEDEYGNLLQQQPYGFYPPRHFERQPRYPPFPTRQQPYEYSPFPRYRQEQYPPYYEYYPPQGYPPRVEDIVRQRVEEEFKKREPQQSQPSQAQQVVTITEPLRDAEGKLVYDKDGNPVYRKVTGPMSQIGVVGQEDPEMKMLKKGQMWKDLFKPERTELSEDRIRTIVREESGKKEEPITKEDVAKASREAAATVLAAKEEEDKAERHHQETLRAIRESGGQKTVEGYKTDEFRFMGQAMHEAAHREPKTVKIIIEGVKDILYGGEKPTAKEIQPGASEGVLDKLNRKYVAEE